MLKRAFSYGVALSMSLVGSVTLAESSLQQPSLVATAVGDENATQCTPTAYEDEAAPATDSSACGCAEEPACGCDEPACGCEPSCGCNNCGCDSWCLGDCLGDCCLGEACTLQEHLTPCCSEYSYGGWLAMGYYDENERLSAQTGDGLAFLDVPDHVNLDQAWLYGEKLAVADACSAGWGWRADILYGVDAQKTQAFGNGNNTWDNSLDHGYYGWAIPQAYGEVAYGDWSVKLGHFFTIIGYEVVQATGNFFYSHSYTMFNSEPFTHTGALATYKGMNDVTLYGGWTAGWDTGFDQALGGSNFLGGVSMPFGDSITVTYALTAGNFGLRSAGQDGYSHSIVAVGDLSDKLQYVLQSDYVNTDGYLADPTFDAEDIGINQYLFYSLNDCWKLGSRMEWWKSNTPTGGNATSFYELTGGINYFPHANVVIRPEIRYNWSPSELFASSNGAEFNNTVFAVDAVVTF